jgi:RND family efflux transporter MFP subunit
MNMLSPVDAPERDTEARTKSKRRKLGLLLVPVALVAVAGYKILDPGHPAAAAVQLADVTVARPLSKDVTEWDDYVGRFVASRSVEVRPRVSGQITSLHFKDGDVVKSGQALFTVDQRPFLAAENEARANVASALSTLTLARSDMARAARLSGDDSVSAGEIDQLRSRVQSAQAGLAAAQARLRQRSLDVEWTTVRAPISGRISDRRIDVGNLVIGGEGASATLLTTINAVDPIYFSFDASEALYLKAQRAKQQGKPATGVQVRLQDEAAYKWTGKLDFTDNGLDPRSGSIRGRATIANASNFLTPGMFGNMRLATGGTTHALLIPDASVQADQAKKSVLVVAPDGTVVSKQVTLGPAVDGLRIVRGGLLTTDRVVIANMQSATPGSKVSPHVGKVTAETDVDAGAIDGPVPSQATFSQ